MRWLGLVFLAAITVFSVNSAQALTLTNRDAIVQEVVVTDAHGVHSLTIQPGQSLGELCLEGCTISLANGDEETFEGLEVVYIEGDRLVAAE